VIIRWTVTALHDLEAMHAYIAEDNPRAAGNTVEVIVSGIDALGRHSEMGRRGRMAGTRELIAYPYIIAYRAKKGAIEIIAIIHGSRRWPDSFSSR
jgi:toxin ParE1/3/4